MQRLATVACTACGSPRAPERLYVKNGCDILRCADCGLGRTMAHGFDPESYYTGDYFEGAHADGYAGYGDAERVLRREFRRTVDFVRRYKESGWLLEIGCAYGFLLKEAERHFDVVGVEISAEAAEHARAMGLRVICGAAESDATHFLGGFDVILMLDVIEHLRDPEAVLAHCAHQLNPGGILMLTTGDFASLAARLTGAQWRLMTPPQHLWFFTPQSISQLADRAGFDVVRIDHPWKLVPLSLIGFQLRRMLGFGLPGVEKSDLGIPVNLFDAMRVVLRKAAS